MNEKRKEGFFVFYSFSANEMFRFWFHFVLKLKKFIDCKSWALVCLFFSEFENELISNDHHHYIRWKKTNEKKINEWMNHSTIKQVNRNEKQKAHSKNPGADWWWLKFLFLFCMWEVFLGLFESQNRYFFWLHFFDIDTMVVGWLVVTIFDQTTIITSVNWLVVSFGWNIT